MTECLHRNVVRWWTKEPDTQPVDLWSCRECDLQFEPIREQAARLDGTRSAMVDPDYHWRSIHDAPLGVKIQLLTEGGVAIHGSLTAGSRASGHFLGWTPLPKRPEWML